ncbi:hypothetical protein [Acaryochloris thomasi]|uniref:hypothetical protein n=1 Tax=Acaryochloris thomasi TaxID=2929456 RepID=UPI0011B61566|nr:hypothetical protein [Acaryochloris thomasi]
MAKAAIILATALALGTTALPASALSTQHQVSAANPDVSLTEGIGSGQLLAGRRRRRGRFERHGGSFKRRRGFCRRSWSRRKCAFEKFYARKCQYRYRRRECKRIFYSRFDRYDRGNDRFDVYDDRNDIRIDRIADYILKGIF